MSRTLNELGRAWRQRVGPSTRRVLLLLFVVLVLGVAQLARLGSSEARALALSMVLAAGLVVLARWLAERRRWRRERDVLRRVVRSVDRELGERALRAYGAVERTNQDAAYGSPELARHHYERLLAKASSDAVSNVASQRARRWNYAALALFAGAAVTLVLAPLRTVEGLNVLLADDGVAPFSMEYLDRVSISSKPPTYLREPERTLLWGYVMQQPKGSLLTVRGEPRFPGRFLVLTDGNEEIPFVSDGRGGVVANWTLNDDAQLWVAARFGEVLVREAGTLQVAARLDERPSVTVDGAPRRIKLADLGNLDFRYTARDDHGLTQVDLVLRSGKREERRELVRLDGETEVHQGGHSLGAGDRFLRRMFLPVTITVAARDGDPITGPKWGESAETTIVPPPLGGPESERYQALEALRDGLVTLLAQWHALPATGLERVEAVSEYRSARKEFFARVERTLAQTYSGLGVPRGMQQFVKGRLDALERTRRLGVSEREQLEDAALALDVALQGMASREAQGVALRMADVVDEIAEGARQARDSEGEETGLRRLDIALSVAREGAKSLLLLGSLGRDLGSVAQGDLARVSRARAQSDLTHTELAAQHLAERLRRPNPSFGSKARGGVESGSPGGGMPDKKPSEADEHFDQLAAELEQLAREHAREIGLVEEALSEAEQSADKSALKEEAERRAEAVRRESSDLPLGGSGTGSPRATAAMAREHAEAMAQNLERLELADAVQSGKDAVDALDAAERRAREGNAGSERLDQDAVDAARAELKRQLEWAESKLAELKRQAERQARRTLGEIGERERDLARRAGNLAGRGKNPQTSLPDDIVERLDRAESLMRQAARELAQGSTEEGLALQRDAQRLLERSRTGQTTDTRDEQQSEQDSDASDPRGRQPRMGGDVPKADEQRSAEEFRRRVLEGLGKGSEDNLSPAVKRYAEGLLR